MSVIIHILILLAVSYAGLKLFVYGHELSVTEEEGGNKHKLCIYGGGAIMASCAICAIVTFGLPLLGGLGIL